MKFGNVLVPKAQGLILAHAVTSFKKGHVLTEEDVQALTRAGIEHVIAAELESGDVHEDTAAARIGQAARGANSTASVAQTGRVNIHAASSGLVIVDTATVNRLNTLHEGITLATLRPHDLVGSRQILATIKIIPFAVPDWAVRSAEELVRKQPLAVVPFASKRIVLISTILPGMKLSLLDKTHSVLETRVEALGSTIIDEKRVAHDAGAIADAIAELIKLRPDIVMIMGASATTDRDDCVPAGIAAAGGHIEHFGMPVDPGNLLLLAELDGKPVIGVPGCARSPKLNGLDFVLQRLCANIQVLPSDIQAMGVGGLLKEISTRPYPREKQNRKSAAPRIEAIVLAAGRSTRMGESNKLLLPIHGEPMIRHSIGAVLASRVARVKVVTGHDADAVRSALQGLNVEFVHNPDFASGMASSLKAGIAAVTGDADAALICLGDMPAVTPSSINRLIEAFSPSEARSIIVPTADGKRGNPVLFDRQFFGEMASVQGDTGARALLNAYPEAIYEVEMDSAAVLADADTPAAFAALQAGFRK